MVFDSMMSNPCNCCPPLPFMVTRGGAQGEVKKSYSIWLLVRPVARRCPSGRVKAKLRCLVGRAAAWPGWTVHARTLGLLPEWFGLVLVCLSTCLACHVRG
jgi:hypothetical protein